MPAITPIKVLPAKPLSCKTIEDRLKTSESDTCVTQNSWSESTPISQRYRSTWANNTTNASDLEINDTVGASDPRTPRYQWLTTSSRTKSQKSHIVKSQSHYHHSIKHDAIEYHLNVDHNTIKCRQNKDDTTKYQAQCPRILFTCRPQYYRVPPKWRRYDQTLEKPKPTLRDRKDRNNSEPIDQQSNQL